MKVSITPGTEKRGLLVKKTLHTVTFSVTMSEEEKAKVDVMGIRSHDVVEGMPILDGITLDITVGILADGREIKGYFENEGEASGFIEVLKGSLQNLKSHMDAYRGPAQAEEFEL